PATSARQARGRASVHRRCASAPLAARAPAAAPLFPPRQLGLTDAIGIDAAALALVIAPRRRAGPARPRLALPDPRRRTPPPPKLSRARRAGRARSASSPPRSRRARDRRAGTGRTTRGSGG